MKRAFALVILVAVAMAGLATAAQAHKKSYKTELSQTQREFVPGVGYKYTGSLLSSQSKCERNAIVDVRIGPLGEYHLINSDSNGVWVVPDSVTTPSIEYQVDVFTSHKPIKNDSKHQHLCKPGHGVTTFPALSSPP